MVDVCLDEVVNDVKVIIVKLNEMFIIVDFVLGGVDELVG